MKPALRNEENTCVFWERWFRYIDPPEIASVTVLTEGSFCADVEPAWPFTCVDNELPAIVGHFLLARIQLCLSSCECSMSRCLWPYPFACSLLHRLSVHIHHYAILLFKLYSSVKDEQKHREQTFQHNEAELRRPCQCSGFSTCQACREILLASFRNRSKKCVIEKEARTSSRETRPDRSGYLPVANLEPIPRNTYTQICTYRLFSMVGNLHF